MCFICFVCYLSLLRHNSIEQYGCVSLIQFGLTPEESCYCVQQCCEKWRRTSASRVVYLHEILDRSAAVPFDFGVIISWWSSAIGVANTRCLAQLLAPSHKKKQAWGAWTNNCLLKNQYNHSSGLLKTDLSNKTVLISSQILSHRHILLHPQFVKFFLFPLSLICWISFVLLAINGESISYTLHSSLWSVKTHWLCLTREGSEWKINH